MRPYYEDSHVTVYNADVLAGLRSLSDSSVHCCVTSPPYWGLRSYLPNTVQLRHDIPDGERDALIAELTALGIFPIGDGV